jgi:hypothetical protein
MKSHLPIAAIALLLALPALAEPVRVPSKISFADPGVASDAVRKECQLETNIPQAIAEAGGDDVKVTDDAGKSGKVFTGKITNVLAPGGGAWSGPKSVLIEGELKENGKVVGTVAARRNTTRGGYGTCGMLNHAAKAAAKDIAEWFKSPSMDARLGDAKK